MTMCLGKTRTPLTSPCPVPLGHVCPLYAQSERTPARFEVWERTVIATPPIITKKMPRPDWPAGGSASSSR